MSLVVPDTSSAPSTVTEYAARKLRNYIILGHLTPGTKVPVRQLATELNISRVPLREAVRQLESESLVDNIPRRGTVVRELSEKDLRDSFEILQHIEPLVVRRAACMEDGSIVNSMQYWLERMQDLSAKKVPMVSDESLDAHREFHFSLFRAGGEGVLQNHLCMLWNTCERYVMNSLPDFRQRSVMDHQHAELVKLIRSGDARRAVTVLEDHLTTSLTNSLRYLER